MQEQYEEEFQGFLSHVKGCRSAIEIGSRYGKSIERIAAAMAPGSVVVSVDWPYADGSTGGAEPAEPILRETMKRIGEAGYGSHLFLGNSREPKLVEAVLSLGPFDLCFIDGDHSYEGVKADWENYGSHARIVAFHDIINNADCLRMWNEVKAAYPGRTVEYTSSLWLGIGVLIKEPNAA